MDGPQKFLEFLNSQVFSEGKREASLHPTEAVVSVVHFVMLSKMSCLCKGYKIKESNALEQGLLGGHLGSQWGLFSGHHDRGGH